MALQPRPANCERSRAWVSVRLDGELSEFEGALLDAHLRVCAGCSEYEATVRGAALALRALPHEQLGHPVAVPGRRRLAVRPVALARVAAAVAVVVGAAAVVSTERVNSPRSIGATLTADPAAAAVAAALEPQQLRALRVIQLGGRPPKRMGVGEFGPVLDARP